MGNSHLAFCRHWLVHAKPFRLSVIQIVSQYWFFSLPILSVPEGRIWRSKKIGACCYDKRWHVHVLVWAKYLLLPRATGQTFTEKKHETIFIICFFNSKPSVDGHTIRTREVGDIYENNNCNKIRQLVYWENRWKKSELLGNSIKCVFFCSIITVE